MLRYQYSDRGRIEADRASSSSVETASGARVEIVDSSTVMTIDGSDDSKPLITEDSQLVAAADLPSQDSSSVQGSVLLKSDRQEEVAAPVSVPSSAASSVDRNVIATSNSMIAKSYGSIPNGSLIYVEKVVCDPPLVYKTDALTTSVENSYAGSGKFKLASAESVKRLRSNFEYQSVANNGDWGNLANLARSEKYDYVFYGAIGEQNGKKLLTYYLIKVSTGEIVWENTSSVS